MVNVLGKGLIWGLIAAPTAAVVIFVIFFWIVPWLFNTPFLGAVLLAVFAGIVGFSGGFLAALVSQLRDVLRLPVWCQVVHILAMLAFGFATVGYAVFAFEYAQDYLAGRSS